MQEHHDDASFLGAIIARMRCRTKFPPKLVKITMKKMFLALCVVISFAFYARLSSSVASPSILQNQITDPTSSPVPKIPVAIKSSASPQYRVQSIPAPAPSRQIAVAGKYKDGTYTGPVTDAYYGNVEVEAVISGGKLTDVIFLQHPSDRSTSVRINNQAMPILTREAIAAQSASVDTVSGATETSQAFKRSLSAALSSALNS